MNKSYSKIRHIQESNQRLEKRFINESFWTDNFGEPSVKDASHTHKKKFGFSSTGRDDQDYGNEPSGNEHYIDFEGQKYYDDDIEYAGYDDLGDLPRVEGGKLIIANPAWSL